MQDCESHEFYQTKIPKLFYDICNCVLNDLHVSLEEWSVARYYIPDLRISIVVYNYKSSITASILGVYFILFKNFN